MSARVPLLFGVGSFGEQGKHTTRFHTLPECQSVIDLFVGRGYSVFDCARAYGFGTTEEYVGQLDLRGGRVDTKAMAMTPGDFAPEKLRAQVMESIKALGPHKIRVFYLHVPDRSVPYEDILREVDKMHKEGLFEEFGLSNHLSWEVAEYVMLARANGWIQPTVYQGCYNTVERTIEAELIPCLRKYGLRFYAYSPLASGLLQGKLLSQTELDERPGSRWDPTNAGWLAHMLKARYKPLIPLLKPLKETLEKHNITLAQAAYRWLQHHSLLTPTDGVILGASTSQQVEQNINDCEQGPLPADVVDLLDEAWSKAKATGSYYAGSR